MVKDLDVNLVIIDNSTGAPLIVPVLPTNGRLAYDDGDQKPISVDILDIGAVDIPAGVELDSFSWDSFFPARYDESYCKTRSLLKPIEYRNRFSGWKDKGASLQVVCPAFGINKTMYIASFKPSMVGFEGDIEYRVTFKELKIQKPKKIATGATVRSGPAPEDRPKLPAADTTKSGTYTVQKGDTLSLIGKKVPKAWRTIYEDNKTVIGPNPDRIFPGQVYRV